MKDSQLTVECRRCGKPATDQHHQPYRSQGGTEEDLVPMCRACHDEAHARKWKLVVDKEKGVCYGTTLSGNTVLWQRGLVDDDISPNPESWSTEKLASTWGVIEDDVLDTFKQFAELSFILYERFHWHEDWARVAAEKIADTIGRPVHWRRLYEGSRCWETYEIMGVGVGWDSVPLLGASVAKAIAEAPPAERDTAFEFAAEATEKGANRKAVAAAVRKSELELEDWVWRSCPACGKRHRCTGEKEE